MEPAGSYSPTRGPDAGPVDDQRTISNPAQPTPSLGDDASPTLLFAGDLDRDGKLDLIFDTTDHYNVRRPTLFLSSQAAPANCLASPRSSSRSAASPTPIAHTLGEATDDPAQIDLNWLAVLAAAVSAFVLGGLWYGPLFKRAWCREAGIDPDARPSIRRGSSRVAFACSLLAARGLRGVAGSELQTAPMASPPA